MTALLISIGVLTFICFAVCGFTISSLRAQLAREKAFSGARVNLAVRLERERCIAAAKYLGAKDAAKAIESGGCFAGEWKEARR